VVFVMDKVSLGQVSVQVLRLSPVGIISLGLHTDHLNIALIRRTNGRILGTPKKVMSVGISGNIGKKKYFHFVAF
jgi:hypothetical protein